MPQQYSGTNTRQRINDLSLQLFWPLARLWLRHGFTAYEIQEMMRWSMARVALEESEFSIPGRNVHRQTMARAAVLTGLPRREVQRLSTTQGPDTKPLEEKYHRVSRLLQGWQMDADFLDEDGKPACLPMRSVDELSFTDLAYRYCRDVPARAMADELLSRGNVEQLAGRRLRLVDAEMFAVRGEGDEVEVLEALGCTLASALCNALDGRQFPGSIQHAFTRNIPLERMPDLKSEMHRMLGDFVAEVSSLLRSYEDGQGVRDGDTEPYGHATVLLAGEQRRPVLN